MVSRKKSAAFPPVMGNDISPWSQDWQSRLGPLEVDNPDGTVEAFGLGPYEVGGPRGRQFSQGAGTTKESGNAGGRGKTLTVKGGTR